MTDVVAVRDKVMSLSLDSLENLPKCVGRPTYSRESLSAGIVHSGVGNFHRAHQAIYLGALMNAGRYCNWAVVGASVMPGDARVHESLLKQDCLGTVTAQSATESEARVTGVMIDYLPPADKQGYSGCTGRSGHSNRVAGGHGRRVLRGCQQRPVQ